MIANILPQRLGWALAATMATACATEVTATVQDASIDRPNMEACGLGQFQSGGLRISNAMLTRPDRTPNNCVAGFDVSGLAQAYEAGARYLVVGRGLNGITVYSRHTLEAGLNVMRVGPYSYSDPSATNLFQVYLYRENPTTSPSALACNSAYQVLDERAEGAYCFGP